MSGAIHGTLVVVAIGKLDGQSIIEGRVAATTPITIESIAPSPVAPSTPELGAPPSIAPASGGDAGAPRSSLAPAHAAISRTSPPREAARDVGVRDHAGLGEQANDASLVGDVTFDRPRLQSGGDGGLTDGAGRGTGHGLGGGIGDGLGAGRDVSAIPRPPPPPSAVVAASKARPARLIYPSRHSDVEPDVLFVAHVTVDGEGYVVGAKLTRGFGGPRDSEASSAIFRFRYDPALDDAGRPIVSSLDQPFHVAR